MQADVLLSVMVDRPEKLSHAARKAGADEWRCLRRHLLAAVIKTTYGPWLYWHDNSGRSDGWQCAWQADLDVSTVSAWCNCPNTWTVDIASPGTSPTLLR